MRGLLDLTDNIERGVHVGPPGVVAYDPPDPYLVVAADKGTATFSDVANGVAAEYGSQPVVTARERASQSHPALRPETAKRPDKTFIGRIG
jgi:hypothetical protein